MNIRKGNAPDGSFEVSYDEKPGCLIQPWGTWTEAKCRRNGARDVDIAGAKSASEDPSQQDSWFSIPGTLAASLWMVSYAERFGQIEAMGGQ